MASYGYGTYGHQPVPPRNPEEARKVFVGNIAFEVPAQVLYDIFAAIGSVQSFQLHPDTKGRALHRGSGIVEFADAAVAQRAITLVNGQIIAGRPVRVTPLSQARSAPVPSAMHPTGEEAKTITRSAQDASRQAEHMPMDELWHVLAEAKALATADPDGMQGLLERFPALTQALLTACNKLGLVSPSLVAETDMAAASSSAAGSSASAGSSAFGSSSSSHPSSLSSSSSSSSAAAAAAAAAAVPASVRAKKPLLAKPATSAPTDPRMAAGAPSDPRLTGGAPSDPRLAGGGPPAMVSTSSDAERETIRHILSMTPDTVAALDPSEKAQVQHIRDALMMPVATINTLPPHQRDALLQARSELQAVLGSA